MKITSTLIASFALSVASQAQIVYQGDEGPGKGKHIVFVASDHEYRAEESCPALARILAKHHGFKCTVLFGVNKDGFIDAGASNIKGLEALKDADSMVIFTRFLNLPDEQMKHIVDFVEAGKPVAGLRTSSHAFRIPEGQTYSKFDFKYKGEDYLNGFGEQVLGNTWEGHHGRNHKQGTRIQLEPSQKQHPILRGVADNAFCYAGGYTGVAREDFTVLAKSQPLVSMDPKAAADKKKVAMPSAWTRHYKGKNGQTGRVFHSTQGASEDLLDENYRRLVVNGIFWINGLEEAIKADNAMDLVGPYTPNTFKLGGYVRGVKPEDLQGFTTPIMPSRASKPAADKSRAKKMDVKRPKKRDHKPINPPKDAKLKQYFVGDSSPRPKTVAAIDTALPLELESGATVALVGNLLLDQERRNGALETSIQQLFPQKKLHVRNLAWPGDEVDLMPRPAKFGDLDQYLTYIKADVIIAAFGYNESFAGEPGLAEFKKRLEKWVTEVKRKSYNGKSAPKLVLLSPVANEDTAEVKAAQMNNQNIALYTAAMKQVAEKNGVGFVDVYQSTAAEFGREGDSTCDGNMMTEAGYSIFAQAAIKGLFGADAPKLNPEVRELVLDKAFHFDQRYRAVNSFYYTGGRSGSYGYLDFLPAMRNFDVMVANRDVAIHATAAGKVTKPDDSNVPKLDQVTQGRGANIWHTPADELKAFKVDPRFEVNCFASELDFKELACPISIRWDSKGRLWVSTSTTYPHVYPGQKPADKILILEDTNKDGKADTCKTFADGLHMPLSFVLDGKGGVYVSEQPHLTYLQDTDGDDVADTHEVVATGFGMEDSHHALHDFAWTPGGDLIFRESVFHHSQIETPFGPVRTKDSSWFRYSPLTKRLTAFGNYFNTNPWGVSFDKHGHHVAAHPVFASSFHATNPPYPKQHTKARGMQAYSGVCGHDFVDSPIWPKEMQGGFLKNRYKPTNKVEFHQWVEKDDCFEEKHAFDVIFSADLSFIPVDLQMGPRGAAYVSDWYNPIKGHAQYSLRDPRRDRHSGRIWRIVPKGAKLGSAVTTDGKSVSELLEMLKSPEGIVNDLSRLALRSKGGSIKPQLDAWVAQQKSAEAKLQALWVYQGIGVDNVSLLESLIKCDNYLVAAAAYGPLRDWSASMDSALVVKLLRHGAENASQHVRREAVICASYIGSAEALAAVLPVLDQPAGTHLLYAIQCSFDSLALSRHWRGESNESKITEGLKRLEGQKKSAQPKKLSNKHKAFDKQKNLAHVKITCVPERLMFDKQSFTVKAGQAVKLVLENPDATQHNLLILDKGTSIEEVGMAANDMAKSPEGMKKHFVPNDKRVLFHTKLIGEHSAETLRFMAPKKPGKYPFICSFPGHWTVMKGVMVVQ